MRRWEPIARTLVAYAAAVASWLKDLAPYAAIALVVPGGSLMAAVLWRYRRRQRAGMEIRKQPLLEGKPT